MKAVLLILHALGRNTELCHGLPHHIRIRCADDRQRFTVYGTVIDRRADIELMKNIRNLVFLHSLRYKLRVFAHLHDECAVCAPHGGILHVFALSGVRAGILHKLQGFIREHRRKKRHLLTGRKRIAVILRICAGNNRAGLIKNMNFIQLQQIRIFFQL